MPCIADSAAADVCTALVHWHLLRLIQFGLKHTPVLIMVMVWVQPLQVMRFWGIPHMLQAQAVCRGNIPSSVGGP